MMYSCLPVQAEVCYKTQALAFTLNANVTSGGPDQTQNYVPAGAATEESRRDSARQGVLLVR